MSTFTSLDACAEHWMTEWGVPGMAVGVLRNGTRELHAYGITSTETNYPVTADTLFQIGSISKIFTTTLVMRLVEAGSLELDAPVARYLPDLRLTTSGTQNEVTLRHLVTHTSGIFGDHFADFGWGDDALARYCASLEDLPQVFAPGELWSYCNSGFNLAGRSIEVVTGQTFEAVMREQVFEPLGMERTFFFAHEAITYPVAIGHLPDPATGVHEIARRYPIPRASNPAGAIIATVDDLLTFAEFHMGLSHADKILGDAARERMQTVEVTFKPVSDADAWGLGWQINLYGGTQAISHGGATNGFNAHFDIVPSLGFAMVSLTNSGRGAAAYRQVVKWALAEYCGLSKPEPSLLALGSSELAQYAGRYNQPAADINVGVEGDLLTIEVTRKSLLADDPADRIDPPLFAAPIGGDAFVITEGPTAGSKVGFIRHAGGSLRFVRIGGRLAERQD